MEETVSEYFALEEETMLAYYEFLFVSVGRLSKLRGTLLSTINGVIFSHKIRRRLTQYRSIEHILKRNRTIIFLDLPHFQKPVTISGRGCLQDNKEVTNNTDPYHHVTGYHHSLLRQMAAQYYI